MSKQRDNKRFCNRYAKLYDFEINRFSGKAYAEIYRLMASVLSSDMDVLEVATGTGLIAINIADHVRHVEATDFSPNWKDGSKTVTLAELEAADESSSDTEISQLKQMCNTRCTFSCAEFDTVRKKQAISTLYFSTLKSVI